MRRIVALELERGANGIRGSGELGHQSVPSDFVYTAAIPDDRLGESLERVGNALVSERLIALDEGCGVRDISVKNDCQLWLCLRRDH